MGKIQSELHQALHSAAVFSTGKKLIRGQEQQTKEQAETKQAIQALQQSLDAEATTESPETAAYRAEYEAEVQEHPEYETSSVTWGKEFDPISGEYRAFMVPKEAYPSMSQSIDPQKNATGDQTGTSAMQKAGQAKTRQKQRIKNRIKQFKGGKK